MAKKLFIGGLSLNTTEQDLKRTFSQYGLIDDIKIVTGHETGRSTAFGFVVFEGDDDAATAMSELDGKYLDGRIIEVSLAQDESITRSEPAYRHSEPINVPW